MIDYEPVFRDQFEKKLVDYFSTLNEIREHEVKDIVSVSLSNETPSRIEIDHLLLGKQIPIYLEGQVIFMERTPTILKKIRLDFTIRDLTVSFTRETEELTINNFGRIIFKKAIFS